MQSLGTILIIGYVIVLAALFAWLLRRKANARAAYRRRDAVLAKVRAQPDTDAPIVGWIIRDDPLPVKSRRPARDLH